MKRIIYISILFFYINSYSQQKSFTLNWNGLSTISTGSNNFKLPTFLPSENYRYIEDEGIQFISQWLVNGTINENSLSVTNVNYVSVTSEELKTLNRNKIPKNNQAKITNSKARNKNYAVLTMPAIVNINGVYKKVSSFSVNYSLLSNRSSFSTNQPITNSVLSSGSWYKFAVNETGVFKLTKSFLNSLGINTSNLDPRTLKIYGTGGQMLPFVNSTNHPVDPLQNAIKVVGEEDAVFNDGDYILFYGIGPKGRVEENKINTNLNPYIDSAYYYITYGNGLGKRIQPMQEPTGASTITINKFQDYKFHELDEHSISFVGRRWLGDEFDIETTKSFEFNFPNIDTSTPVNFKVIGFSTSSNSTTMVVTINNNPVTTMTIPALTGANDIAEMTSENTVSVASENLIVTVNYDKNGVPNAKGYLDYISIEATRNLTYNGNQFEFKNNETSQITGIAQYVISNASNLPEIWEITDANNIKSKVNNNNSTFSFKSNLGTLRSFVAVSNTNFKTPIVPANTAVVNQNIKGSIFNDSQGNFQDIDYLIITPSANYGQAERLAQINRIQNNLNTKVLTVESIYNEFNTGNRDIAAIRNAVKYIYDNASSEDKRLKYLCLFGDGSFDYKGKIADNTFNLPSWNAYQSFNDTFSFISDDFYVMMDDNEGDLDNNSVLGKLDIAVGRILTKSTQTAKYAVDKIEKYYQEASYGSWRNNLVFISDDVDEEWESTLQESTDESANEITTEKPFFNPIKIHSDAFEQQSSAGGDRYPEVTTAILNAIENGALVTNYFGHGGVDFLALERIFEKQNAIDLRNDNKLTLFITITCDFSRFDNPLKETAGELIFWNSTAGAVGLISTTRSIYVNIGENINNKLKEYLYSYNDTDIYDDNEYPTIGEALMLTKNDPSINTQRELVFCIGDPAMKLAIPQPNVILTQINDEPITTSTTVLEALSYVKLAGEVTDANNNILSNYNGKVVATIYDKPITRQTLANDGTTDGSELIKLDFETLGEVIFRGQATVTNGEFEFDFIVPRDITIPVGYGKISFYASTENPLSDQTGGDTGILQIGGINENAAEDNLPPRIQLYMNDENFVSGGITNDSPTLLAKFQDENGINTASGIGHDIVAILDGDETNPYILNNYYVTELDDYTRGSLSYPFRDLEPGLHTISLKAWDVYNNSSTAEIQFRVFDENENLVIENVLNYPNPFVNYTEFWFTHNSSEILDISIQIFTISGKLVRTLNGQTAGQGTRLTSSTSRDIIWDGRDDFGDKIGKGTYIYKLKVHASATNKTVEKIEKLVIL